MGIKAHMICHTHWDREWYFTREQFRTKLIRLIDELLEVIDTVPEYVSFMLDGQTIIIEDYLEIKPYRKEKLYNALRLGKIICGPWYILPDELLVSGESHIRNYLTGQKITGDIQTMLDIAYLPDSFGHPAQMPQIAKGLGMDTLIFWRGTSNQVKNTEFYWESPDGVSKVLCIHMPHGYGNCGNLDSDMTKTLPRIKNLLESLNDKSTTDIVLLMNGSDHIIGQENITEIVRQLNDYCPQYDIRLSTMEQYLTELKTKLPILQTYTGEFRSAQRSMLLGGTLSSRMMLKINNFMVQNTMERYLEPLLSLEKMLGNPEDSKGYSDYLWRKILENQPHDSICGCSIDEVHEEMRTRYRCIRQLEEMLLSDTLKRICSLMPGEAEEANRRANSQNKQNRIKLLLFEPSQDKLPSYMETEILMDKMLVQEVNFTASIIEDYESSIVHPQMPESLKIYDEAGRNIPYVILEKKKSYDTLYQDQTLPEIYKANSLKVGLFLPPYEYGIHELFVENSVESTAGPEIKTDDSKIENEYYKITAKDGSFTIYDKITGRLHKGAGRFIDKGDAGDEYTYSWPKEDELYSLKTEEVTVTKEILGDLGESLIMEGDLILPEGLEVNRKRRSKELTKCPVCVKVSLYSGINRIDFKTEFDNRAKDHRLQVQFPSGIYTESSEASDAFHVTKRDIGITVPPEWAEYPQTTHPTHGFMNLEDKTYGISAAACGLTEFEAEQLTGGTALNITLLRCVGWLSRTDLFTRKGNGGWTIETPGAQCIGKHIFEYSIAYHTGSWKENNSYGLMEKRLLPGIIKQIQDSKHEIPENTLRWVSELPKEIRLSALKVSEDGTGIIVRIYSIGDALSTVTIPVPKSIKTAQRVNLSEKNIEEIKLQDNCITFFVKPSEIITIKLIG